MQKISKNHVLTNDYAFIGFLGSLVGGSVFRVHQVDSFMKFEKVSKNSGKTITY